MNIKQNIPNLFTLCNLFCGCIAVVFAFEGSLVWSSYLVGVCCLFDFLDGLAARLLKVHSEIGKQLDSLADMVSFGVVPGIIMYKLLAMFFVMGILSDTGMTVDPLTSSEHTIGTKMMITSFFPDSFSLIGVSLGFTGFIITVFSAIRLAKFNLDLRQTDSFIGLPTPANTIFIASLPMLIYSESVSDSIKQIILHPCFLISVTLISSISLISPISLFALKFKNFSWEDNKIRYVFLLLSLALLIIFRLIGIPLIIVLYIVLSIINNIVTMDRGQVQP